MEDLTTRRQYMADADAATQRIVDEALARIDWMYSYSGDPKTDPLAELYFPYHNGRHARNACQDVRLLRDVVGLTAPEYNVALAAAATHDIEQEIDAKDGANEETSRLWLRAGMERFPETFSSFQIQCGELAVLGTFTFREDNCLRQRVMYQEYPSRRAELIADVVAAADVGRLYAPDGPLLSHRLYQERRAGASGRVPSMDGIVAFQQDQVEFLEDGYCYPTRDIEKVLTANKAQVCNYAASLLVELEQGSIETWDELINRDTVFMRAMGN